MQNNGKRENEIICIPMFYLLNEIANIGIFILGGTKHENTIWFYFDQQWGDLKPIRAKQKMLP